MFLCNSPRVFHVSAHLLSEVLDACGIALDNRDNIPLQIKAFSLGR